MITNCSLCGEVRYEYEIFRYNDEKICNQCLDLRGLTPRWVKDYKKAIIELDDKYKGLKMIFITPEELYSKNWNKIVLSCSSNNIGSVYQNKKNTVWKVENQSDLYLELRILNY